MRSESGQNRRSPTLAKKKAEIAGRIEDSHHAFSLLRHIMRPG